MAGKSAKRIAESNAKIIALHFKIYLAIIMISIIVKLFTSYTSADLFWFVCLNLTTFVLYLQMKTVDLSREGGLLSFYYDILYVSWFTLLASNISSKFYWTLILIPLFGLYKLKSVVIVINE